MLFTDAQSAAPTGTGSPDGQAPGWWRRAARTGTLADATGAFEWASSGIIPEGLCCTAGSEGKSSQDTGEMCYNHESKTCADKRSLPSLECSIRNAPFASRVSLSPARSQLFSMRSSPYPRTRWKERSVFRTISIALSSIRRSFVSSVPCCKCEIRKSMWPVLLCCLEMMPA